MNGRTSLRVATTGLLAAVLLAACGSDEPETPDTPAGGDTGEEELTGGDTATEEAAEADAETDTEAGQTGGDAAGSTEAPTPTVAVADTELGSILVDGEGRTLYLFTNDTPNTSVCEDACLDAWPILEGEPQAAEGVDSSLIGSIERADGTVQATYAEWPLYYFVQDAAAGDLTGQAVNDVWWVVSPEGEAVTEPPAETGTSDGGSSY